VDPDRSPKFSRISKRCTIRAHPLAVPPLTPCGVGGTTWQKGDRDSQRWTGASSVRIAARGLARPAAPERAPLHEWDERGKGLTPGARAGNRQQTGPPGRRAGRGSPGGRRTVGAGPEQDSSPRGRNRRAARGVFRALGLPAENRAGPPFRPFGHIPPLGVLAGVPQRLNRGPSSKVARCSSPRHSEVRDENPRVSRRPCPFRLWYKLPEEFVPMTVGRGARMSLGTWRPGTDPVRI